MAVSPPPATILASTSITISDKIPDDLDTNVHQNAWHQIVKEVDIAGPALCPVPFIDRAHYFDLLNVFAEVDEPMLSAIKSSISKNKKYKYMGKLKSIVSFLTEDNDRINDIMQLRDQTPVGGSKVIEHLLLVGQANGQRNYRLCIENPKVHAFHFNMDPSIAVGIDRTKQGMEAVSSLLIIAEVFSGSKVSVQSAQGEENEEERKVDEYVPSNDPIPLAFAAIRVKVDTNGAFKLPPRVVSPSDLSGFKHWIFTDGKVPQESVCIRTLTNGLIYNVDRRRKSYDSLLMGETSKEKKSKKCGHHHRHI